MSSAYATIAAGLPAPEYEIIDMHNHIGPWYAFHVPKGGGIVQMLSRADKLGIGRIFISAHAAIGPDFVLGNNIVMEAIDHCPQRVWGYLTVNPNYPQAILPEMERCLDHPGIKGMKVHPALHGQMPNGRDYEKAYAMANELGLPVLVHSWGASEVYAVEKMAGQYPKADFILAHVGADDNGTLAAIEVINRNPNIYGDLAVSRTPIGGVEYLVEHTDASKLFFGTDMPFYDPCITFARVLEADISDGDKRNIFSGNAKRLLGIS